MTCGQSLLSQGTRRSGSLRGPCRTGTQMIADPNFALRSLVGSAILFAAMPGMSIAADDLTIASWGGAYQESQRMAYFTPFAGQGNKITEIEHGGEIDKVRAM